MEELESLQAQNQSQFEQTPVTKLSAKSQAYYANQREMRELNNEMKKVKLEMQKEKLAQYKQNKAQGLSYNGKPMPNNVNRSIADASGNISRSMAGDSMYQEYNTGQLSPFASDYFNQKWMGIDFGEVTDRHKDKYHGVDPFSGAKDWEHLRRESQGTLAASTNLLTQFIGKSAVNAAGGVIGGFYSLGSAAVNMDSDKLFDNSVNRAFDSASEWMDKENSVFTSEKGRKEAPLGIFSIEATKDVSDAYSFITGAVASELLIDTFSGGLGLAGLPGRIASKTASLTAKGMSAANRAIGVGKTTNYLGKAINASEQLASVIRSVDVDDIRKVEEAASNLGMTVADFQKARKGIDRFNSTVKSGRGLMTGTFWEAGLEARGTKDDLISHETEKLNIFLDSKKAEDPITWNDERVAAYRAEQEEKIQQAAESAGLITFALNTAVLGASNYIQFPTIFGGPKTTSMNSLAGTMKKNALGEYVKTGSKALNVAKTFGNAMKSSATEFMEETLQGTINTASKSYYESMLGTRSSDGELIPGTAKVSDAILAGLNQAYGTEEGRHEGYIGAVVGAIGLPMLKRNKKGKLRSIEMTGGIAEAIRDTRQNNIDIKEGMDLMNKTDYGTLLSYNKDNAILATIDSKKEELARLSGDKLEVDRLNDNKVFRYVQERLDKGLGDFAKQDIKELVDMDVEEYKKKFGKDEAFTQEMKDKEVMDFAGKVDIYTDAYKKVYEGLRLDRINNNHVSKKLFDTLTYAVANDKIYGIEQNKLVNKILSDSDLDMSSEEILELAQLSGKYQQSEKEIEDIIAGRKAEKVEAFEAKKANMFARVQAAKDKIPVEHRALAEEIMSGNMDSAEYAKKVIELRDALKSDEYNDIADTFEFLFNSKDGGFEAIAIKEELAEEFESRRDKETEIKKPGAIPAVIAKRKSQKELLKKVNDDIEKSSKESLDILRGKKDKATTSEINRYIELKQKAQEALKKKSKRPTDSILDSLGTDKEKSVNELMDELKHITRHRTLAVEIAANLYGFDKISNSYAKIANASILENLNNIKDLAYKGYIETITDNDSEELSIIAESMRMSIEKIESDINEYEELIDKSTRERLDEEVERAKKLRESLLQNIEKQDTQEDEIIKTKESKKQARNNEVINTIDLNAEEQLDEVEDVEAEQKGERVTEDTDNTSINPFNFKNTHTVRVKPKELPANASEGQRKVHENRQEFLRKLEVGEIKYNSASVMEFDSLEEESEDFKDFLEYLGISESYESGRAKIEENPLMLKEDVADLDPDVIVFLSNFPSKLKIYNNEVKVDEGVQKFNIREDDIPEFELIQFAAAIDVNPKAVETFNAKKDKLYKAYNLKQIEINENTSLSDEEKTKQLAILKDKWQAQYEDLKAEFQSTEISANDRALFNMRQSLMYNLYNTPESSDKPANELKMRLGGIIEGPFEKSGDLAVEVEEFGLTDSNGNVNFLVPSIADLTPDMFLFGKQDGTYVDFNDREQVGDKALNRGSLNSKKNALTGRVYLKYKTVNGRTVPVMLNRGTLSNSPALVEEMLHQIEEYLKDKNKLKIVTIKNPELSFLSEKTFDQFFQSILGRNKSTTGFDIGDSTLNIDAKGNIRLGRMDMVIDKLEQMADEDIKASIQLAIEGSRFFLNSKQLRNPNGSVNEKFLRYIISNKLINHSFNSSKNNDKIFLKESFAGDPYHKSAQFHMLNQEIDSTIKGTPKPKIKTLKQSLRDLFGKRKGANDKSKLTWESAFATLNYQTAKHFEKNIAAGLDKQAAFDKAVNDAIQEKLDLVLEMASEFPNQYTPGIINSMTSDDKIIIKADDKIVDKYVKLLYKYKNKISGDPTAMNAFLSMNTSKDYDIKFKKLMLDASPVRMMTAEPGEEEYEDKGTIKKRAKLSFKLSEALTSGTPAENKRKVTNLIKALNLLNQTGDIGMSINKKHFQTAGIDKKAGGGNVYINHVKTYAYFNKKSGKIETALAKNNDYKIDSKGVTYKGNKEVKEDQFDNLSYKYWHEGQLKGSNPIAYKVLNSEGELVYTEEPELDFKYDENGNLTNGVIYLVTVNANGENGQRQPKVLLAGNGVDPGTHQYISTLSIPGLNQDYEIDEDVFNNITELSMEVSKGWGDVNKIVDSNVKNDSVSGDIKLGKKEESEDTDSDDSDITADDALESILGGFKKKANTGNASKVTTQDKKEANDILRDAMAGLSGEQIGPSEDIDEDEFEGPPEDEFEPDENDIQDIGDFDEEADENEEAEEDDIVGKTITAEAPMRAGSTKGTVVSVAPNNVKPGLFTLVLDSGERVSWNKEKNNFVWVQGMNKEEKITLNSNNRIKIKASSSTIKDSMEMIEDAYENSGLSEKEALEHVKSELEANGAKTYGDFIEIVKIVNDNNVANFEKMAKFVAKIHGKEYKPDNERC